jgi:PAS domain S-box-containing protein
MIMETKFIPSLVMLSVTVAIFASYVALNLTHSLTHAKGKARALWLGCGALAMGIGIWSMHFVGMLAFEMPGMDMAYDIPLAVLSVLVAIVASALALYVASRPAVPLSSLISGGIAMAAAINGMHYIGMFSMRMAARIEWNIYLVLLSVVIALVASFAALLISIRLRNKPDRQWHLLFASVLMGFAISGMHYTGMFAATFVHDDSLVIRSTNLLVTSGLTVAVVSGTLLILGLALAGSIGERFLIQKTKRAEEVLNSTEEKFRLLVEAIKDYAIFMLDPSGRITSWNSGAERITGYTDEEIIGKPVTRLYTREDIDSKMAEAELKIAREKGHFEREAIRVRKDGSTFWANIVIAPLYDQSGAIAGFSKITRDVTRIKETEEKMRNLNEELEKRVVERTLALQERESQLRMITNALPALIAEIDCNERILFANEAFANWWQVPQADIVGMAFKDVLGHRYESNRPYIEEVLKGHATTYERHSVSGKNEATLSITYVPEFTDAGDVKGFIVLASDITKHKAIESELNAAKEAAEVANATKSAFLANMSHEIRTPLGAILGFSELMLHDDVTSSEKINNIEIIRRNGKLLSNIINDILDLSKVEAGKLEIEKDEVQFADLLSEIGTLLNLEAAGKGVKLTISSEGLIPNVIRTDSTRLRQILFNVIGNAIKFTEKGSVEVKVQLITAQDSTMKLVFSVKDTGTGISAEKSQKLFSPFTQADVSTTRRFGGTGLGLVLAKKLANALGGDVILAETAPNMGSTFVVTIDPGQAREILFESPAGPENKVVRLRPSPGSRELSHLRVLVVDDSPDNQALIKKFLTLSGASVETANNGREGFEKAVEGGFDIVLMDLQMPEMDGYEATQKLRTTGFKRPIVALTAHAMKEERRKCLESGFNEHLTKPVDPERLLTLLLELSVRDQNVKTVAAHDFN